MLQEEEESLNEVGYDDIGGCRKQLAQIKEVCPHSDLFVPVLYSLAFPDERHPFQADTQLLCHNECHFSAT